MKPGAKNHNISLKNLNLRLKNLKPRFNRGAKNHNSTARHHVPARVSYNLVPILLAAACFIASPCAFATDATDSSGMRFNVQNAYSIEIILPELDALSLTPTSAGAFTSQNIAIGVGTSNPSGYTLTMSAESTDMTRSAAVNGSTPTIPTLESAIAEASFPNNHWGFKRTSGSNIDTLFQPMSSSTAIPLNTTAAAANAGDSTTNLTFGVKLNNELPAGTYKLTLNFLAVANEFVDSISDISQLEYMQEFASLTSDELTAVKSSMTEGAEHTLKDSRDETPYYIAKLADGNVWMTQNLDFDIEAKTYTPDDTDIPANWTVSSSYATKTTTSWSTHYTSPESYNPGDLYWSGTTGNSTTSSTGNKHYHLGNYYNWSAAVAMDDTSAYGSSSYDGAPNLPDQSICPAGWTLPRAGTGSDTFYSMLSNYGLTSSSTSGSYSMWTAPLYFALSGKWEGYLSGVGSSGYYWSAVSYYLSTAYNLYFYSSSYSNPLDNDYRYCGYPVRCVARPLTTSLTGAGGGFVGGGGND